MVKNKKKEDEFELPESPTVNDIDEMEARKAKLASETPSEEEEKE